MSLSDIIITPIAIGMARMDMMDGEKCRTTTLNNMLGGHFTFNEVATE